jgi:3-mercaptopyruvate sulfurtransferase SseA
MLVDLDEIGAETVVLPRERGIVFYCACPNEISARRAAQILLARGHPDVRALAGGLDGWIAAGHAVEAGAGLHLSPPKDRRGA